MKGIASFADTMGLDRGILATLASPEPADRLPGSSALHPPGALRGTIDDGPQIFERYRDPLLAWAAGDSPFSDVLTPSGFQTALGQAAGSLSVQIKSMAAREPGMQAVLRDCLQLVTEQLQLVQLADFNRNALMQG